MLNAELLVDGLLTGLFYALMAVGLSLVFGVLRIVNFAHGEFYMVGAYAYTLAATALDVSPWLALPFAVIVGAALGAVTERLLIRPLYAGPGGAPQLGAAFPHDEYAVIVTFGLSILLVNLVDQLIGPFAFHGPALASDGVWRVGRLVLTEQHLIVAFIALLLLALTLFVLRYTLWGKRIRALSQNRLGATLAGIDTIRASMLVFALAGALAALAGALLSPFINPTPDVGTFPGLKSYVIIVLGGMGSIPGAIIASLVLGVVESFGSVYISYEYRDTFGLFLLLLCLLIRPQGLFGQKMREL